MALDKAVIPISFAQGVDTKTDRKQVVPGRLLTLENGVFQTTNAIIKRNGYQAFSTTDVGNATITSNIGLGTLKDTLFAVTDGSSRSYSAQAGKWSENQGPWYPVQVTKSQGQGQASSSQDCAYDSASGLMITVWFEYNYNASPTNRIKYNIKDVVNNTFILNEAQIDGGSGGYVPRCFVLGSYFIVTYIGQLNGLYYVAIPISNPTNPNAAVQIASSAGTTGNIGSYLYYEGMVNNNILYLGFPDGGTATSTSVRRLSSSLVVSAATTIATADCRFGLAIIPDASNNVWFATNDKTNIKTFAYTNNMVVPLFGVTTVDTRVSTFDMSYVYMAVIPGTTTRVRYYYQQAGDTTAPNTVFTNPPYIKWSEVTWNGTSATVTTSAKLLLNAAYFVSKPITYNSVIYLVVSMRDGPVFSYYLIKADQSTAVLGAPTNLSVPVAKFFSQNAIQQVVQSITFQQIATTKWMAYLPELNNNSSYVTISFDHKPVFAELANGLHVTGGFLYLFDGVELAEHNFLQAPNNITLTSATTPSPQVPAGTYYYAVCYEWQDSSGQIQYGQTALSASITVAATSIITIKFPWLRLTNRKSPIYVGIYRSTDGQTYYKLPGTGVGSNLENYADQLANGSFADNVASTAGQPILYTSGGVVDNYCMPSCSYVANYKKRMIAIPSEQPTIWWFSQEIASSIYGAIGNPVEFSTLLSSTVDEKGGGITGVIQMDDKLMLFKNTGIFAVQGDGPSRNNTNNDFTPAQLIATDTGATSGLSLVLMPNGVMYQSAKGIYLVDRSLSVSYIGAPVEAYNSDSVLSAELIYNLNQIRFGMSSGVALVYNYIFNQWSIFTNHAMTQAVIYGQKYTFAKSNGVVWQETPGSYFDAGANISLKLTTSWLSFAQLQGYQRVYKLMLLGEYYTPHTLQVTVAVDFDPTIVQTTNIVANASTVVPSSLYQWRYFFTRQKCQSLQFTIQDSASAGTLGQGYSISSMGFEVGSKKGLVKKQASNSVG